MKQRFEFKCQNEECGEIYEGMIEADEIEETEKVACVYCHGKIKRVWGVGSVFFKGTGFTRKQA